MVTFKTGVDKDGECVKIKGAVNKRSLTIKIRRMVMYTIIITMIVTLLLGVFVVRCAKSRRDLIKALVIIGMMFVGGMSNGVVIIVNNNRMPVSLTVAGATNFSSERIAAVKNGEIKGYAPITKKTKLWFLADIIPIWCAVVSVGDIFYVPSVIMLGIWFLRRREIIFGVALLVGLTVGLVLWP